MTNGYMRSLAKKYCNVLVAAFLMLLWVSIARGEVFYGVTANGIFKVDVNSGTFSGGTYATVVNFATPIASGATLATRPSDGVLFYLDTQAANPNLWRFDPSTPVVPPVLVGTTGLGTTGVVRLGFDAAGTF